MTNSIGEWTGYRERGRNIMISGHSLNPTPQIPIDFSDLELEFLPYFLTSERVHIEWDAEKDRNWITADWVTSFYVGLEFIEGFQKKLTHVYTEGDYAEDPLRHRMEMQIEPHYLIFNRMKNKNSKIGYSMESKFIESITGTGICHPNMNREWTLDRIIQLNFSHFISLRNTYPIWINHKPFEKALKEFNLKLTNA